MASELLREIGPFSEQDMIEPDAVAEFCFFIGDLNFRFNCTYTNHIQDIERSPELAPTLD